MRESIVPAEVILDQDTGETYVIYKAGKMQACYKLKTSSSKKEIS